MEMPGGTAFTTICPPPRAVRPAPVAEPENIAVIADDHVEGPVSVYVDIGERIGGIFRITVIKRLQNQLAAASLVGRRAQRTFPVGNPGKETVIIEPQPCAPGQLVPSRDHIGAVLPVPCGRCPGAIRHFVPVGCEKQWPGVAGTVQNHHGTHEQSIPLMAWCGYIRIKWSAR